MAIRPDKRNIPTVAEAVDRYIQHRQVARIKSIRDEVSVLRGPRGRVVGKGASGPALAKSELGPLRMDRLETHQISAWFQARHPETMAQATVKRGMSHLRGFLEHACAQGWADERILGACMSIKDSNPSRDWLRPKQLLAYSELVDSGPVDPYQRFEFITLRDTGQRSAELVSGKVSDLKPAEKILHTPAGKGRGAGKRRDIPVSSSYVSERAAHVERFGLRPTDCVCFKRDLVPAGGRGGEMLERRDLRVPSTTRPIRRFLNDLDELARSELPDELVAPFPLTPKVLRRTYACTALILNALGRGGLDIYSLQRAMGHASLDTTAVYLVDVEQYLQRHRREFDVLGGIREMLESGDSE